MFIIQTFLIQLVLFLFTTIAHQRLVVLQIFSRMYPFPTRSTEVAEACFVATEDWARLHVARAAQRILEVRVNLDFLAELAGLYVDKASLHGPHVALLIVESNTTRADRVLEFVRINSDIRDAVEQIVYDSCQAFSREHAVQCAHEHGSGRIESLARTLDIVAVGGDPWNHLHILVLHATRAHLEVVLATLRKILFAHVQQVFDTLVTFKHDVQVALTLEIRVRMSVLLAFRPLNANLAERFERFDQALVGYVPWHTTEKYFGRVDRSLRFAFRQLARPCATRLGVNGRSSMHVRPILDVAFEGQSTGVRTRLSPGAHTHVVAWKFDLMRRWHIPCWIAYGRWLIQVWRHLD